jgi:hypothetical protein
LGSLRAARSRTFADDFLRVGLVDLLAIGTPYSSIP